MESEEHLDGNQQAGPVETVGERLRAAREKAGLSIQDVAERTRVPARHLTALEKGNHAARTEGGGYYDGLPALAYSAGFVRAFAELVGLDGKELAAQYRLEASPDPLPYYDQHEPLDPARVPSAGVAWIAAGVGAIIVALLIAFSMGAFSGWRNDAAPVASAPPSPAEIPAAEDPLEHDAASAAAEATATPPVATAPAPGAAVVMTASEDAWIKVYDRAGQTVRMGILKQGESYAVPGDPNQLLLWTGKAGAIKVTVGGKPVAPLGQPVQTVRDISLAPASLLARSAPGQPAPAPAPASAPQG